MVDHHNTAEQTFVSPAIPGHARLDIRQADHHSLKMPCTHTCSRFFGTWPHLLAAARSIHTVLRLTQNASPHLHLRAADSCTSWRSFVSTLAMKFKFVKGDRITCWSCGAELCEVLSSPLQIMMASRRLFWVHSLLCSSVRPLEKLYNGVKACLSSWHPQKGTASCPLLIFQ